MVGNHMLARMQTSGSVRRAMLTEADHVPGIHIDVVREVRSLLLLCLQAKQICLEFDLRKGYAKGACRIVVLRRELDLRVRDVRSSEVLQLHKREYEERSSTKMSDTDLEEVLGHAVPAPAAVAGHRCEPVVIIPRAAGVDHIV